MINCTYAGLQAACLTATYLNLCWDIPWNRGVRDCMDIVSDVGTVNNCAYPAPCAMATISAVIVTIDAVWRCLSQMVLASENYGHEAMAVWSGTSMAPIFAGTSQHGFAFAATEMSHFGGGGGASCDRDGVDTAGIVFNTTPNMPNVEDQEAEYPVLYLFRRHLQDSGGPGKFRGGRSGELAYTIYDAPTGELEGLFAGTGAEMPNGIGIAGGMPGSAISIARVVDTDIAKRIEAGSPLPDRLEEIDGKLEWLICKHIRSPILAGDVWYHSWQGGGGYGDPLLRDPARVADDLARGAISRHAAAEIYGVVLARDGSADLAATERRRGDIRAKRRQSNQQIDANGAYRVLQRARTGRDRTGAHRRYGPGFRLLRPVRPPPLRDRRQSAQASRVRGGAALGRRAGARRGLRQRPFQASAVRVPELRRPRRCTGRARRRALELRQAGDRRPGLKGRNRGSHARHLRRRRTERPSPRSPHRRRRCGPLASLSDDRGLPCRAPDRLGPRDGRAGWPSNAPCANLRFGPPIDPGGLVYAVGANYPQHAEEAGLSFPSQPIIFSKAYTALSGRASRSSSRQSRTSSIMKGRWQS